MPENIFFWSWPIWAKLSFVLGSLLVLVLSVGIAVKSHKFLKRRRLSKSTVNDVERPEITERIRSSDEIPFGAKAMLEDPDIEGVWNSKASTPLQSPVLAPQNSSPSRQSLNPFSKSRRNSSVSSFGNLSSPATPGSNLGSSPASVSPGDETESFVNTVSALDHRFGIFSSQKPESTSSAPSEITHMPRRRSVTIRAATTPRAESDDSSPSDGLLPPCRYNPRGRSRVSTDPIPATPQKSARGRTLTLNGGCAEAKTPERTPTTRKALDRMEAHRKFHAAESGQLQPRLRINDQQSSTHKHSASDSLLPEQESPRAVSWPITNGEVLVDLNATQKIQTKTSPQVVPFKAFIETHPPPTSTLVKAPPSAWTAKTQGLLEEKLEMQTPKKRITIKSQSSGHTSQRYVISNRGDSKDVSEGVSLLGTQSRTVNDGFEILPAGKLSESSKVKDFGYTPGPLREASNEIGKSRRLQKRSRSSSTEGRCSIETMRQVRA